MSQIHSALLRKDNYFKTLPVGKLVKILALLGHNTKFPPMEDNLKISNEPLIKNKLNISSTTDWIILNSLTQAKMTKPKIINASNEDDLH